MSLVKDPTGVRGNRAQEDAPASLIISYLMMRVLIGVIAVPLPFVLILANWAIGHGVPMSGLLLHAHAQYIRRRTLGSRRRARGSDWSTGSAAASSPSA